MKFFWNKAKGLNADIERHRAKEQKLQAKIDELKHKTDEMSVVALRTCRHFMYQLQVSKADVVNKIGKK